MNFIHAFIHLFIHSFIHSFIHPFAHSFFQSFLHSFFIHFISVRFNSFHVTSVQFNSVQFSSSQFAESIHSILPLFILSFVPSIRSFPFISVRFNSLLSSSPRIPISRAFRIVMSYFWNFRPSACRALPGKSYAKFKWCRVGRFRHCIP